LKRLHIPFELVGFSEIDPYAIKAYCALHNESESKNIGDITKFQGEIEPTDIFFYSPPCQSYSLAGKQEGFEDPRGVLFFDALRLIKQSKPKYCIMENVKGLTTKKFTYEFKTMLESLEKAGYNNYHKILNAKDYGIPQNRERIFIVSIRKDVDDGKFEFPTPIALIKTLTDIIEPDAELPILHNIYGGFNETEPRIFNEYSPTIRTSSGGGHIPSICLKNRGKIVEKTDGVTSCIDANYWKGLDNHAQRTGVLVKGCSLRTRNYRGQSQKLEVRKDDLSNTLTTVQKDSMLAFSDIEIKPSEKKYKEIDGYVVRTLTTLETLRLMDYDDEDWIKLKKIKLSDTRIYRLCGNSIVINVICEILKKLLNY
jgi:DNA (cytosine-5)-methyltransferase 1